MMRPFLLASVLCLTACGSLVDASGKLDVRTIGPAGGRVVSSDGRFTLDVPAGALDHEVTLSVTLQQSSMPNVAGSLYAVAPVGTELAAPAHLSLTPVSTPGYSRPPSLGKVSDGSWDPIPGSTFEGGAIVDKGITRLEVFAAWVYCSDDDLCNGDMVCDLENNTCGKGCQGPADCGGGQECRDGRCKAPCDNTCASSTDCSATDKCAADFDGCLSCVAKDCLDKDGDGYGVGADCVGLRDCNDGDPTIYPGATEICDGFDNDCNGSVDECPQGLVCYPGDTYCR